MSRRGFAERFNAAANLRATAVHSFRRCFSGTHFQLALYVSSSRRQTAGAKAPVFPPFHQEGTHRTLLLLCRFCFLCVIQTCGRIRKHGWAMLVVGGMSMFSDWSRPQKRTWA